MILMSVETEMETSSQVKELISEAEEVRGREVWIGGAAGECLGGSIGSFWFLIWRTQFEVIRKGGLLWRVLDKLLQKDSIFIVVLKERNFPWNM